MIKTKIIKVAKDKQRSGTGFYNSPTYSNSSTNINVDSELLESSTNPVQNAVITNELNQIKADAVNTVSNTDNTLDISKSGNTVTINSKTWKFNESGDLIYDGTIIPNEVVTSILNADTATLETLTVTKAAHFFQLVIDEIKSTQGQVIITAANAKLDLVEQSQNGFKCLWKNTDGDKTIYNQFAVDDQVICQTFNLDDTSGTNQTNKFYWSKVLSAGTETKSGETYNYIVLSTTDYDTRSNATPSIGDEIVQLGNRTNADRQAAIIISAYNNQYLDNAIQAPSIVQYNGINDYNLNTHRLNVISKGYNSFKGNFTTTAGENLENKFMPYFPINAPFYLYDYTMEEPQDTNPIRYNGYNDIYSTPTFLNAGKYKFRVFINSNSLSDSIDITNYGTTYPSTDLGNYSGLGLTSQLGRTTKTMKVGNDTFYEYAATITLDSNGYYGLNYWEGYQIYIPENDEGFETNFSKIEQTNTRITTQVNNINGQISTINQKADSIEAAVNDVTVRLDNGGFTINADTSINGSLTVTDAKQGFILNGANGNTYIVGDSIGTYEQFKSRTYVVNYYNATTTSSSTSQTVRFNTTLNMGQLPINTTLDFQNFEVIIKRINSISYQLSDYSYNLNLKKDGTVVHAISGNNSATPSVGISYTTNGTIGNYVMEIQFLGTVITVDSVPQCQGTIYFEIKVYTSTFNLIGTDGIASNFGVNKTFYVGNEGTYIRYTDDNVLKISNEGIQKYAGSIYYKKQDKGDFTDTCTSKYIKEFSPINGLSVRTVTALDSNNSNCYLQPNDEMILFKLTNSDSGKRCDVCLPQPTTYNCGRKVYLKKMTGYGDIYVWGDSQKQTGLRLIRTADGSTVTNQEIDYASRYFISDGEFWIEYYSG